MPDTALKKIVSRYASSFRDLSQLQEPSSFEDRRHRFLDPRGPRSGLLRAGEVKTGIPFADPASGLERALELRIVTVLLLQLLRTGNSGYFVSAFSTAMASRT